MPSVFNPPIVPFKRIEAFSRVEKKTLISLSCHLARFAVAAREISPVPIFTIVGLNSTTPSLIVISALKGPIFSRTYRFGSIIKLLNKILPSILGSDISPERCNTADASPEISRKISFEIKAPSDVKSIFSKTMSADTSFAWILPLAFPLTLNKSFKTRSKSVILFIEASMLSPFAWLR